MDGNDGAWGEVPDAPVAAGMLRDRDGNGYAPVRRLRLLDAIDAHVAQRADGAGHAVVEPVSGKVLATGDTAEQAQATAEHFAGQLGRRRLQAAIDAGGGQAPTMSAAGDANGKGCARVLGDEANATVGNLGANQAGGGPGISRAAGAAPKSGVDSSGGGSAGVMTLSGLGAGAGARGLQIGARQLGVRALGGILGEAALPATALGASLYGGWKLGGWIYDAATGYVYGPVANGLTEDHSRSSVGGAGGESRAGIPAKGVADDSAEYGRPGSAGMAGPDKFTLTEGLPLSPPGYRPEAGLPGIPPYVPTSDGGAMVLTTPIRQQSPAGSIYVHPAAMGPGLGLITTYPADNQVPAANTMLSEFGPKSPQSALSGEVSYPDPAPRIYKGDMTPDTLVIDHNRARALGGDATDPFNLDPRMWAENAQKGGHEGNYIRERDMLVSEGLTLEQAEWVLEPYRHWIENDIHATPVDPNKLKDLPSP